MRLLAMRAVLSWAYFGGSAKAQCPSDMNVAPSVPGLSGVEMNGAQCVCPATSYYWRTGFIFCFGAFASHTSACTRCSGGAAF